MDLSSRRWSSRSPGAVRSSVRVHANGPGGVTTLAAVVAIGVALAALGAAIRTPAGSVRAALGGGAGRAAIGSVSRVAGAAALPDVPWLAQRGDGLWVYGKGERGPVRRLPDGETGLAIAEGLVASVVADGAGRSTVRFRDRASGRVTSDVAAPIWVSAGAWTREGLVVTGYGDASMASDGGLVLVSAETGTTRALLQPSPFSARLGRPVARGDVVVSASGATVASNVCGIELCDLQVVELATGAVSRPIDDAPGFLRAVTDETVVTTDDAGAWISARAITTGAERWRVRNRTLLDPMPLDDGSIAGVIGSMRSGWAVTAVDRAGRTRDLTPRGRGDAGLPQLWRTFLIGSTVVVGTSSFAETLARGRPSSIRLVDARDGSAVTAAVHLPATSEAVP